MSSGCPSIYLSKNSTIIKSGKIFRSPVIATFEYDTDALTFISRAEITDDNQISAIDTLVKALKSEDLWDDFDIIYPFVGNNADKHAKNLKSSNYDIVWGSSVIHSSSGIQGIAGTSDLSKGVISDYYATNWGGDALGSIMSYVVVAPTNPSVDQAYFGTKTSSGNTWIYQGKSSFKLHKFLLFVALLVAPV